ncbi:MAG: hypothetical protein QXY37_00340 [Metallosphaera sp.]
MVFEIKINTLPCDGKKGFTTDGNYFCISNFLSDELAKLSISPAILAEAVIDFLNERMASYTTYWGGGNANGSTRVLDLYIITPDVTKKTLLMISNFNGISEISLLEQFFFEQIMEKLMNYGKNLEKYEVTMPFLYKFVIFETFNVFRKLMNVKYQGIVSRGNEKYMLALENEKALVWKVEEPKINLINKENVMLINLNH